jgi:hypothetical protein
MQGPLEIHQVNTRLPLKCVALGDNHTHVISYEDGRTAWSAGLSVNLVDDLNRSRCKGKPIETVALGRNQGSDSSSTAEYPGPGEVWFMMRDTGCRYMGDGCEGQLQQLWNDSEIGDCERIERVAFATNGGWCVRQEGGGGQWVNLPDSLAAMLRVRWWSEGGVRQLSVGHHGEWFVLFESGSMKWEGVHPTLDRILKDGKVDGRTVRVEWVELGPGGTFVAVFDSYTVWYGSKRLTGRLRSCL